MTSIRVLANLKQGSPRIDNVLIFVSDSLRWDYLPASVAARGVTFKTVASSLFTASSFPSMVTGLYPPGHSVHSFFDRLPRDVSSLFNLPGFNTSLWNENTWIGCDPPESTALHRLLGQRRRVPLDQIDPPFIYVEDEKGGHCPFGWSFENREYEEWECDKFFEDYGQRDRGDLVAKYCQGIERSVREFEKRLEILRRRGLLDTTLVIFTSDHGELLGEYGGHVGHGEIACPQVAYVPTVFIHPRLPGGVSLGDRGVLRHVDLYPTVVDILGMDVPSHTSGVSALAGERLPSVGYNHMEVSSTRRVLGRSVTFTHREISVWDKDGGHVFRESRFAKRVLDAVLRLTMGCGGTAYYLRGRLRKRRPLGILKDCLTLIKYYTIPHIQYGSPSFDAGEARRLMQDIRRAARTRGSERAMVKKKVRRLRSGGRV